MAMVVDAVGDAFDVGPGDYIAGPLGRDAGGGSWGRGNQSRSARHAERRMTPRM